MSQKLAGANHEKIYQGLMNLMKRNVGSEVTNEELLAIASNIVGKVIAMQDQRTMTHERAMQIVVANIELGNQQVIDQLLLNTAGRG